MDLHGTIIGKLSPETRIYRIFPRKRFLELFNENQNALVLPTKWEDPFENAILNAEVRTASGEVGRFGFHDDVYGQCWTLQTASDAMWQIYSRAKDAVRLRTTVGKLLTSLGSTQNQWANTTSFIGRVHYHSERRLKEIGRTLFQNDDRESSIARSLLMKRKAYKHENEVRLIYIERTPEKHPNGVFKFSLEPRKIFDQVMVDGRVKYKDFLPFKEKAEALTGLPPSQIKRSMLYRKPSGFVVELP